MISPEEQERIDATTAVLLAEVPASELQLQRAHLQRQILVLERQRDVDGELIRQSLEVYQDSVARYRENAQQRITLGRKVEQVESALAARQH